MDEVGLLGINGVNSKSGSPTPSAAANSSIISWNSSSNPTKHSGRLNSERTRSANSISRAQGRGENRATLCSCVEIADRIPGKSKPNLTGSCASISSNPSTDQPRYLQSSISLFKPSITCVILESISAVRTFLSDNITPWVSSSVIVCSY